MKNNNVSSILTVTNLTKSYKGVQAVDKLNFDVKRGEIFGFLGPNGAGKSTTISMISGLIEPDDGDIYINGVSLKKEPKTARGLIGICPQNVVVWKDLTCYEQIELVGKMYDMEKKAIKEKGMGLLESMGLIEKKNKLAKTLSGGMQRRLNIILALVHSPELVILDEPEAGLDPQSKILVRDYIKSLAKHKTVLLTTHNMDEADRVADRIAIIDKGKLLVIDTSEQLKNKLGQGDVLEIKTEGATPKRIENMKTDLSAVSESFSFVDDLLNIVAPDILDNIQNIKGILQKNGITVEDIRFRKRTLEDVFITLTGRGLRE